MCGILGVSPGQDEEIFRQALDLLEHRGPDGYGIWSDDHKSITLGHRRLSILDLSENGAQPMVYGPYMITFNGEIFNFLEIKNELIKKGYTFRNDSDTEVILAAYMEYGPECLKKFNGMWAFAIWNKETKELFLARDRYGIKPLFYSFTNERFVFASEMKAIFPYLNQVEPSEHFDWCMANLFEYEVTDKCLIKGIKRFPAGHYAYLDGENKKLNLQKYWETLDHLEDIPKTHEEQVERFRELFLDAVKIRMRSDVSIGASLSGGIDSSAVVCAMANIGKDERTSKDWQHAFIARFKGTNLDESFYSGKVIDHVGIKSTFNDIDPAKGVDKLERYLYLVEDIYLTSPIPMMDHYGGMRENGVVVSLDGQGADELMCGYGITIFDTIQDRPFYPKGVFSALKTYGGMIKEDPHIKSPSKLHYLKQLAIDCKIGVKHFLLAYKNHFQQAKIVENPQEGRLGYFNQHLYSDFHKTVIPTLLRNYDRYSMGNGIEIRLPFMDYRLVSYCFSLPWESKFYGGYTKSILREAMKDYMPKEILTRTSKIGFGTPFTSWMKGGWREYLLDTIHSHEFKNSQLIDSQKVGESIKHVINHTHATHWDGECAWAELMPFLWEKAVLNRRMPLMSV